MKPTNKYELKDVGCYVDANRGIYAVDAIVAFAESHGMDKKSCNLEDEHDHAEACFASRFAGCEFANEVEDEATDYMNANYAVDGASWGRSEQGDWGLWPIDDDGDDEDRGDLIDDGRSGGYGESYGERNV